MRRHLVITGRVQGVGFRVWVADRAVRAGLSGLVRNLEGGQVEVILQGPIPAVEQVVASCWIGPARASVRHIEIVDERPTDDAVFSVE